MAKAKGDGKGIEKAHKLTTGKGDAHGYGEGENVHKGKGSKSDGVDSFHVDGGPGGHDAGAEDTEKRSNATFAVGGKTKMFDEQRAGPRTGSDKSPSTGKPDSRGPGDTFAEGGKGKMFPFEPAKLATAGITSAY